MPVFNGDQLPEFGQWLQKGLAGAARRGVLSAAYRTLTEVKGRIIPDQNPPPVDQSTYLNAWQVQETPDGADLYNAAPHAPIVEWGARAENIKISIAMIEALTEWVIRHGMVPRPKGGAQATGEAANQARGIAWAIAISMKSRGIFNREGQQGLRIGEKAAAFFRTIVQREIAREVENL
jgi:hypothetical protein